MAQENKQVGRRLASTCSVAKRTAGRFVGTIAHRLSTALTPLRRYPDIASGTARCDEDFAASTVMTTTARQLSFSNDAIESSTAPEDLGEVFTRRWVVEMILDLAGYRPEVDLARKVAVEPACGRGAFVVPMVERLVDSCRRYGRNLGEARGAVRAFDLSEVNVKTTRIAVIDLLLGRGVDADTAHDLATSWIREADFLLDADDHVDRADYVLGNPPYIRLEDVPEWRTAAYRQVCPTMRGRADVFVGFIERGLCLLSKDGVLGFIVADRWMRNQYGAALRELISSRFSVESVLQLHDVDAFEEQVSAYPAVITIRCATQQSAVIADTTGLFGASDAATVVRWAESGEAEFASSSVRASRLAHWFDGRASWPTGTPEELALVAELESRFPTIEDLATRTRVGIGVATGADAVYLTKNPEAVEQDRMLPLAMAGDTIGGTVNWSGTYMINPWRDGKLVPLSEYPRLAAYLDLHSDKVRGRHVAQRNQAGWYRTIDRVEPGLQERDKLLFPDLKAAMHPVLDRGSFYPHHNLYFVTSEGWDLEVLGGLLLSDVANLLVGAYCVKMRGGCYRFQAQYVRRIRVPQIDAVGNGDRRALARAFASRDTEAATGIAIRLYGLDGLPRVQPHEALITA
jgi:adenine-specific DNA-methyltransferase